MGMDGAEIMMDVEDHFGITIRESEAGQVRTVGDLVSLIESRIIAAQKQHCSRLSAFLALRKAARALTGDETLRFRPRDAVTTILNARQRRELWMRLSDLLGAPPNPLRRPRLLGQFLAAISVGLLALALVPAIIVTWEILPLTAVVAGVVIVFLYQVTARFRNVPPEGWKTFGEITTKLAGVTAATKMVHLRKNEEILDELRPLLVNVLGVDTTAIVPESRFVEDLGMT